MPFSFRERQTSLSSTIPPDLLVIGGGVVGCRIADTAAQLGLSCVLLEKEDIASGASGNSSGLAHAGLRYLAQKRFGYVFRSSRQRRQLQDVAPHWVRPFAFILPVYQQDPYSFRLMRFGTWLYELFARIDARLSGHPEPPRSRRLSRDEVRQRIPGLQGEGLLGGIEYFVDAQLQDARFTLGLAQRASRSGARILTHMEVQEIRMRPEGGARVTAIDRLSDTVITYEPKLIINASGAWIDDVRHKASLPGTVLGPSRGIHLVVDHIVDSPLILNTDIPGKVVFVLPVNADLSVVGTTDTPVSSNPDQSLPDPKEVQELLQRLFHFFPYLKQGNHLQEAIALYKEVHVRSVFWATRPLLKQSGSTLIASREHELKQETSYFWSIPGVKLTSGFDVGETVAHEAWKMIKGKPAPKKMSDSLPGGELWDYNKFLADAQKRFKLGEHTDQVIAYLISLYGTRYVEVVQWANRQSHYRERIHTDEPWILAQVPYAVEEEMALTLNDLLWRRTKWALYRDLSDETILLIARDMGDHLKWSGDVVRAQIAAFKQEQARHRVSS